MTRAKITTIVIGFIVALIAALSLSNLGPSRDASAISKVEFVPNPNFRGQIVVGIIEPQNSLRFLIDLNRGAIAGSSDVQRAPGSASPGNSINERDCQGKVEIPAPDRQLGAYCTRSVGRYSVGIRSLNSNTKVLEWPIEEGWEIGGIVWSYDSKSLAVLLVRGRMDLDLSGLMSAASGHPISLNTFKVLLVSRGLEHQFLLPVIRKDSLAGMGGIDWVRERGSGGDETFSDIRDEPAHHRSVATLPTRLC